MKPRETREAGSREQYYRMLTLTVTWLASRGSGRSRPECPAAGITTSQCGKSMSARSSELPAVPTKYTYSQLEGEMSTDQTTTTSPLAFSAHFTHQALVKYGSKHVNIR